MSPAAADPDRLFSEFRRSGDPRLLGEVYDHLAPELLRVALHTTRDAAEAEDVLQATFLVAIQEAQRWDPTRRLMPWLVGILANEAARSRERSVRRPDPTRLEQPASESPDEEAQRAELLEQLDAAFERIPAAYRPVLQLRLRHGLSLAEIAATLERPAGTVRSQLARGTEILRRALPASLVGALVAFTAPTRGLAAVRDHVLGHVGALKTNVGVASFIGGVLAVKKLLVLAAVLIAAIWLWPSSSKPEFETATTPSTPHASVPVVDSRTDANEDAASTPAAGEREPVAGAPVATREAHLDLSVAGSDGTPVQAAQLVLYRDEKILATGTTDENGTARFDANEGSAQVAISAPGWALAHATVDMTPGRRTIVLADGAALLGRVLVDGRAPQEPIELEFDSSLPPSALSLFPKSVLDALVEDQAKYWMHFTITNPDGSFSLRGLPVDSTGQLTWHEPYCLDSGGAESEIRGSAITTLSAFVELKLVTGPQLSMRVVDADGIAAPGAKARVNLVPANLRAISNRNGTTDEVGRFMCPLGRTPPISVEVRINRPDGSGAAMYKLYCPPGLRGIWDVGDLALARTRTIHLRVQDSSRTPIADARAVTKPSGAQSANKSDTNGKLDVFLAVDDIQIMVQALGYQSALVDAPPEAVELEVTLTKACMLEFKIEGIESIDPTMNVAVRLIGPSPMFVDESVGSLPVLQSPYQGRDNPDANGARSYRILLASGWRATAAGLRPGVALKAELQGANGPVLAHVDIAPLLDGEHRTIELVMNPRPKSLRVIVLNREQKLVPNAHIRIYRKPLAATQPGPDGAYVVPGIFTDEFTLEIQAVGYPAKLVHGVSVPPDEITVTLDAPRALEIEAVHLDGSPATEVESVAVGDDEQSMESGTKQPDGRWKVQRQRLGRVMIRLHIRTGPVIRFHDTLEPSARIVIGHPGKLQARVTLPPESPPESFSVGLYANGSAEPLSRVSVESMPKSRRGGHSHPFPSLALGAYELRLETRTRESAWEWTLVGTPANVVLDDANPTAEITLQP